MNNIPPTILAGIARKINDCVFTYNKCGSCGLIFLVNVPESLDKYYAEEYYEGQMPHNLTREIRDELVVKIPSGRGYETCLSLQKNKILDYDFEAEKELE